MTATGRAGTATPLSAAALPVLRARGIPVPDYDRAGLVTGIVHIGVGGFHRAHQAMFVDRLLGAGHGRDFAICGVGLLEADRRMAGVLADQDGLYTLVLKHPDGTREPRVIGSIVDYLFAPDDVDAVVEWLASPDTRIVSLTITEGGYLLDPATGAFTPSPDVQHDLAGLEAPRSVFGLVVAGLRRRRDRGLDAFTIMSCDNLAENGHVARAAFAAFAELLDPDLAAWIAEHVRFPSSMVDRITPVTTDDDRAAVRELGIDDAWPVVTEPYVQWVLEDDFAAGRPPLERAGVQVVADVGPWERMKLRLANGGHQAMCHVGVLAGHRYAHEAAGDPAIAAYLAAYLDEAAPTLERVPGLGLEAFQGALLGRWTNPAIADTLDRIRTDSSDRLPPWLLPVVVDNLAAGRAIRASALACAAWAHACEGVDDAGRPLPILDRAADELARPAVGQRDRPTSFLEDRGLFGDLVDDDRFRAAFLEARESLLTVGARATAARFGS
jgi:mannitol 2-dehydrogenase